MSYQPWGWYIWESWTYTVTQYSLNTKKNNQLRGKKSSYDFHYLPNIQVLSLVLKTADDLRVLISDGRLFHSWLPVKGNDLRYHSVLTWGTKSLLWLWPLVTRLPNSAVAVSLSLKQCGASAFITHLRTSANRRISLLFSSVVHFSLSLNLLLGVLVGCESMIRIPWFVWGRGKISRT